MSFGFVVVFIFSLSFMEEEGEYAFPEGYSFGEGVAESPRFELEYRGSGGVGSVTGSHIGNTHTEEKRKKKNGKEGRKTHGSVREKKQRHKRPLSRITKEISKQEIQVSFFLSLSSTFF